MPKTYKIKRSYAKKGGHTYRAKPRLLTILFTVLLLGVLLFVGISIYAPVYDVIMGNRPSGEQTQTPEPEPVAPVEPNPEPEPSKPDASDLRAVYASPALVADMGQFDAFLDSLSGTGMNAVMLDIKDQQGNVLFQSKIQQTRDWGVITQSAFDLDVVAQKLESRNLHLIVRASAFRDPLASIANTSNAVHYQGQAMLWLDNVPGTGKPWLNPYSQGACTYIQDLALEAVRAGAVLVVLDAVQFPPYSSTNATFGGEAQGVSRSQALAGFIAETGEKVNEAGARLAVYLPVTAAVQPDDVLYGGNPLELMTGQTLLLGTLPYQFPEDFRINGLDLSQAYQDPAATMRDSVEYTVKELPTGQPVMVLLQGGSEPSINGITYTEEQIDAQIAALDTLGIDEYILYQTESAYQLTAGA